MSSTRTEHPQAGLSTLKAWKARLLPGVRIKQIWNATQGTVELVYTIVELQSNGIWLTREDSVRRSWMSFPKHSKITFTEHGWIRVEGTLIRSEYVWMEESATSGA